MLSTPPTIFLTGATGDTGGQVLTLLQSTSTPTRVLCRRQAQIDAFSPHRGVEAVLGNLATSPTDHLASLISPCTTFFLLTAPVANQLDQEKRAIDAAIASGTVKHVVKIAASDQRPETDVPWAKAHWFAEKYMRERCEEAGVKWTAVRPSGFMSNLLASAPAVSKGFLPQTSGDGRAGWVATADIAAVVHRVMLDGPDKHAGQVYILTGPRLLNMSEMAAVLTQSIGHRVRYLHLPGWLFKRLVMLGGADEFMADGLVAQFVEIIRPGLEGIEVSHDIEKITGRPATSFGKWAAQNRDKFEGFDVWPYMASALAAGVAGMGYLLWK